MKTILLIILYLISSFSLYSQRQFIEIKKEEEIKGKNNTYIKIKTKNNKDYIYNKSYELMHRSMDAGEGWNLPLAKIENKMMMHRAVEKHILPYIKEKINTMDNTFLLGFLSELDGIVKEVTFTYPNDWNIPITALEDLENELLSKSITLSYNRNYPPFKKKIVTTVERTYAYGKDRFTTLRDRGAKWIIDEEDLLKVPEEGGLTPLPGDEKPVTDPDDRDSNPIHDDKDIGPVF